MNANNDLFSDALNISPFIPSEKVKNISNDALDDSAHKDFEHARANVRTIIDAGLQAIQDLSSFASQSQAARDFEVLYKLMDSMLSAQKDLLELQTKIRSIENASRQISENNGSVTNNLFVGSTAELQKIMKEIKVKKDEETREESDNDSTP